MNKEKKIQRLEAKVLRANLLLNYCKGTRNINPPVKNRQISLQAWKKIGGLLFSLLLTKPARQKLSRHSRFFKTLYRIIS
jgi:hypothetical protein